MKLVLYTTATNRLRRIAAYIHQHNPTAAQKVRQAILDGCTMLAEHPYAGREYRQGVRVFYLPRYPYVIYYKPDDVAEELLVLTIRHTSQRGL